MRVLVTGGAGFAGSHLVKYLLDNTEWDVHVLDDLSNGCTIHEGTVFFEYDIRYPISLEPDYDYIVHMAAEGHVDRSVKDPINTAQINVMGTLNVLEFARKNKNLKKFLFFSTDEVFGDSDDDSSEDSVYSCTNPYSATKAAGEELSSAYYYTYKLPVVITHCNNIFGEGQQESALIPLAYRTIKNNEVFTVHTNQGTVPKRSYIYVEDVCKAIFLILEKGQPFEKFNISIKDEYDIISIVECIAQSLGKSVQIIEDDNIRPYTDKQYKINNEKITKLGWKPTFNFFEKLTEVVEGFE